MSLVLSTLAAAGMAILGLSLGDSEDDESEAHKDHMKWLSSPEGQKWQQMILEQSARDFEAHGGPHTDAYKSVGGYIH